MLVSGDDAVCSIWCTIFLMAPGCPSLAAARRTLVPCAWLAPHIAGVQPCLLALTGPRVQSNKEEMHLVWCHMFGSLIHAFMLEHVRPPACAPVNVCAVAQTLS